MRTEPVRNLVQGGRSSIKRLNRNNQQGKGKIKGVMFPEPKLCFKKVGVVNGVTCCSEVIAYWI